MKILDLRIFYTNVLIFHIAGFACCWLFVAEQKQIAMMADEKSSVRISHRIFATSCSEMEIIMKEEYDFSNAKKNPYVKKLKKQITIKIDGDTIDYFKSEAENSGIPYQTLINLYLTDCVKHKRKLQMSWEKS